MKRGVSYNRGLQFFFADNLENDIGTEEGGDKKPNDPYQGVPKEQGFDAGGDDHRGADDQRGGEQAQDQSVDQLREGLFDVIKTLMAKTYRQPISVQLVKDPVEPLDAVVFGM